MSDSMAEMHWVTFFQVMTLVIGVCLVGGYWAGITSADRRDAIRQGQMASWPPRAVYLPNGQVMYLANRAPSIDDDISAGYAAGDWWMHAAMDLVFVATAVPDGAAVWRRWAGPIRPTYFTGELKPLGVAEPAAAASSPYWREATQEELAEQAKRKNIDCSSPAPHAHTAAKE